MHPLIERAPLSLHTVYFHDADSLFARTLGHALYEHLTRPTDDRLAFGMGLPVFSAVAADSVQVEESETTVLIPVLGKTAFQLERQRVVEQLSTWQRKLSLDQVLTMPIDISWQGATKESLGKTLSVYRDDPEAQQTFLNEVSLALTQLLQKDQTRVQLFISHAEDTEQMNEAARQIRQYAISDPIAAEFFNVVKLRPEETLQIAPNKTRMRGVCIVIREDRFSSRSWSQQQLLAAKRNGLPTLTVEVLAKGERRSSPYAGNGPSIVWASNPGHVVSRAMIEWLAVLHFQLEARRIAKAASLPDDIVIHPRPPELLDFAQGPLQSSRAQLVMHPDPELPVIERHILKAARPRIQLVTPTTAFRRLLNRTDDIATVSAPLQGFQVAISLSDSPDVNGPLGFTTEHVEDAAAHLARSLISAGASIAYGGDFRNKGFTPMLAELIRTYNQTAARPAELLHNYLSATIQLAEAPAVELTAHHLLHSPDASSAALLAPPPLDPTALQKTHYTSDMRRVMSKNVSAQVVLGGAAQPKTEEEGPGYSGPYPGVVEEAWRMLEAKKPLYVAGGFGGAGALVADLFDGIVHPRMQCSTWMHIPRFQKTVEEFANSRDRATLGLPENMQQLTTRITELAKPLIASDAESVSWNGLTVAENRFLFRTRDPVIIASLVLKGLLCMAREQGRGKLEIELVHGSVANATNLDAIAIAAFDDLPLGGAGAALDQAIAGRASVDRAKKRTLVSLESAQIDADWLYLASLGPLPKIDELKAKIQQAAKTTATEALRLGFSRLGVVAFGGTVLNDVEQVADAMLTGFADLAGHATVVWFESNREQFQRLNKTLAERANVKLSTREEITIAPAPVKREQALIIRVSYHDGELDITTLPPAGSAIASSQQRPLSEEMLNSLIGGAGPSHRITPGLETLAARGAQLAELIFGEDAAQLLARCCDAKLVIVHDDSCSKLPFEMLTVGMLRPAAKVGISRRLLVRGVALEHFFAKPTRAGPLHVLLIVNPTGDLGGTEREADQVMKVLNLYPQDVCVKKLHKNEATKDRVKGELEQADVLHYCGHAFFDGRGPDKSGLILAGKKVLTLTDLESVKSLPRVAFMNACEAARVRGSITNTVAAFAEFFLRSGIEAYLGTYWEVGDTAAETFARGVYTRLAAGETLDEAVTKARAELLAANEPDWANYILYGDGRFKLVER